MAAPMASPVSPGHFLRAFGVAAAGCVGVLGTFNAAVDPYAEFGTARVRPDTTERHNLALKVALLGWQRSPPEVLILGNSRSMHLPPSVVERSTGHPAFNASTAAASTYDGLAYFRW